MILQALKEYYNRKPDLPRRGWFSGKLDFVIVLKPGGTFERIDCEQITKNGRTQPCPCILPYVGKQALKHNNSGKDANLLWDNATFVLGVGDNGSDKLKSFISTIKARLDDLRDPAVTAVIEFLEEGQSNSAVFAPILKHPEYGEEIRKGRASVTFKLHGNADHRFIFLRPAIKARVSEAIEPVELTGTCLVTGEQNQSIELHHLVIKNLYGARKEPNIVSFNEDAYNSYGKGKGGNAPVSKVAAFAYTTALNHLTARDSDQRMQVGDATVVFWSAKDTDFEKQIPSFFDEPKPNDPDQGVLAVTSLFKSVKTGAFVQDHGTTKFYVLGMTPFGPRIAVRFWVVDTVAGMAGKICQHFEDTEIVVPARNYEGWPRWLSLNALMAATANETKFDNKKPNLVKFRNRYYDVKPNLEGDTMRAVLAGLPYPQTLLQGAIRRSRVEQEVPYPRAALIKACLNRAARFTNRQQKEELTVSLDRSNTNIGYRLGRLFAALERIQVEAHRGRKLNATIRSRYYGAASCTPVAVFGTLLNKLNPHHMNKLPEGIKAIRRKTLCQIVDGVDGRIAFPSHLSLDDQGRFAIGYYHQVQEFDTQQQKGN